MIARTRVALAVVAAAALVAGASAQSGSNQPAGAAPGAPGTPAPAAEPPTPAPIPVPDGPVVKKQELEGGLIVEDIKIGDGYEVKPGGAVVAHYHGTLKATGAKFDSSFERGEPIAFPLNGVIQGWQKGVPGMKVGGIRKLTIPAAMGYGERGAGNDIPPNSDLVFVIQLVDALQIIDEQIGDGEEAMGNFVAVTSHTIVAADGKELEKYDAKKPYIWVPGEFSPISYGLEGMKAGGKRKLIVPKEMNEANPAAGRTLPEHVPCSIEVELIAVRNLGSPARRR